MKNITLTLLAATAIGAVSIGGASAMPFNNLSPALGESHVQNVRLVCNQNGRCYNTNRVNRSSRSYYAPRYYDSPGYYGSGYGGSGYYAAPSNGYYGGPRVGLGIGPFGFGVW
jgi:hypothetical protein